GDIDALLARDRNGVPVLRASHVRGVWKDALQDTALRAALFGASREATGQLSLTSFYAVSNPRELCWSSTSFRENNRAPEEDTLRTRQFVAAGTRFAATAWLPEGLEPALLQAVTRADALGARRRRGDGVITVTEWKADMPKPGQIEGMPLGEVPRLRLLLHAEDPVCLPLTGFPGNILPGECYLRGQQVLGGIVKVLLDAGQTEAAQTWLSRRIRVGNAYPVPESARPLPDGWQAWSVVPVPLAYQRAKPGGGHWKFPWWAQPRSAGSAPVNPIDKFAEANESGDGQPAEKPKRPGDREFLFRKSPGDPDQGWMLFESPMALRMRNALPHEDNQRGGLFTQEEVQERTRFLVEIRFPDTATAEKAAECLKPWIGGGRCLNLGRGGAPVVIEAAAWQQSPPAPDSVSETGAESGELEIMLTADLITRDRTLAFRENLDVAALAELCGLAGDFSGVKVDKAVADTVEVHGFNALTGLPRIPALAIRRGSCWRFTGDPGQIAQLRQALQARLGTGLGERRWEGYGGFLLDFRREIPPQEIRWQVVLHGQDSNDKPRDAASKRERAIEAAEQLWRDHPADIPRLVHWKRLRGVAQGGSNALIHHLTDIYNTAEEKSPIKAWAKWLLKTFESEEYKDISADELYRQLLRYARLHLGSTGEVL
ncbi:hypothetical protein, partial [Methylomagnum sp.]